LATETEHTLRCSAAAPVDGVAAHDSPPQFVLKKKKERAAVSASRSGGSSCTSELQRHSVQVVGRVSFFDQGWAGTKVGNGFCLKYPFAWVGSGMDEIGTRFERLNLQLGLSGW
jgi:hypothetical protein